MFSRSVTEVYPVFLFCQGDASGDEGRHSEVKYKERRELQSINEFELLNVREHPNAVLLGQLKLPRGL
jgi:hypothetical protein